MSPTGEQIATLLNRALSRRADLFADSGPEANNALRLIHGEADGFPGLTVDRLDCTFLVEAHRPDVAAEPLIDALMKRFGAETPIFLKERWARTWRGVAGWQVAGPLCHPEFSVRENGVLSSSSLVLKILIEHETLFVKQHN